MLKRPLLVATLLACALCHLAPAAAPLEQQRQSFLAAETALNQGDMRGYQRHRAALADYPLLPYLDYAYLSARLASAGGDDIADFLDRNADTPLAARLRWRWSNHLAGQARWREYLAFYEPTDNVTLRCHRLQALIATGRRAEALPQVGPIWLHGESQPEACDPVFEAWTSAGLRTDDMVWRRIELAMLAGEWRLARYLGRMLDDADDQAWVKRWVQLYRNPRTVSEHGDFRREHPYRTVMLAQAVRRLASWDGLAAVQAWHQMRDRYPFDAEQVRETEQYIIRNLVRTPGDTAYAFVRSVEVGDNDDPLVHAARIGAALLREDWRQVATWIEALPAGERDDERWVYWHARALEGQGDRSSARALYARVARERSYYGFLAADRIGHDYHLAHAETPAADAEVAAVAGLPGIQRARELFALERWSDARREWRDATQPLDADGLKAAAKLAKQHGWHDRAIFTLAKTGYWDDLELRFPLEHAALVEQNASRYGIDDAWVFAVMRQESAFMQNARSHAGARGLMQLMPATASKVARDVLKREPPKRRELYDPDLNIALGSAYLKQVKSELGGSAVLATAAYNAGPHRVTRWLPERTLPADIWIELVPFRETRGYLRRVLAYTVIYEKRMGREPIRLADRLHPVPPTIKLVEKMGLEPGARSAG